MERDQRRFNFCWSNNHREKGASAVAMLLQQIVHQANAIQLKAVIHFGAYQCNTESASKNQTIKWLKGIQFILVKL